MTANVADKYDFDPNKRFLLPNPDFRNPFKVAEPVAPRAEAIMVYHRNAIRIEKAGLANPFDLESEKWTITDQDIIGPANVDPNKDLGSVPFYQSP